MRAVTKTNSRRVDGYLKEYRNLRYYKKIEITGNTKVKEKPSFMSPTEIPFGDIKITFTAKGEPKRKEVLVIPRVIDYFGENLVIEMNKLGANADKIKAVKKKERALYISKTLSLELTGKENFYQAVNEKGKAVYCLNLGFSVKDNVGYSTHFKKMKRPIYKDSFAVKGDVLIFRTDGKESIDDFVKKIIGCKEKGRPVKIILAKPFETQYSVKYTVLCKNLLNLKCISGDVEVKCEKNYFIKKLKLNYVRWRKTLKK